jgi:hypothetical protein
MIEPRKRKTKNRLKKIKRAIEVLVDASDSLEGMMMKMRSWEKRKSTKPCDK